MTKLTEVFKMNGFISGRRDSLLDQGYDDEEEMEEQIPKKNKITTVNRVALYPDMTNSGNWDLSDADLIKLHTAGFESENGRDQPGEMYFHPMHWRVAGDDDNIYAGGYDAGFTPLTDEAQKWGEKNYGSWYTKS